MRPIFASRFLDAGEQITIDRNFTTSLKPKPGYTFGMVVRRGFTRTISLETGINYLRRNYSMVCTFADDTLNLRDESDFGMVTYEIPIQGLVYIRLGQQFYMNASFGISINWFASDVASFSEEHAITQRSNLNRVWFNPALLSNIGFEYRTEKAGIFYLGASLHRPFNHVSNTFINYDKGMGNKYTTRTELSGSFLTFDVRYFFHAQPIKKSTQGSKKKKKKTEPKTNGNKPPVKKPGRPGRPSM